MGRYICSCARHGKRYFFEYSTISDKPRTEVMDQKEFEAYYLEEYGRQGMRDLPDRLKRAMENGTSCEDDTTIEETLSCNRAGPNETELTTDQIIDGLLHRRAVREVKRVEERQAEEARQWRRS